MSRSVTRRRPSGRSSADSLVNAPRASPRGRSVRRNRRDGQVAADPRAFDEVPEAGSRMVRQGRAAQGWLRRRVTSQREVVFPLATEEVAGPIQFTRGGMFVWFILGGQSWDFRTLDDRRRLWDQQTYRYGQLAAWRPGGRPTGLGFSTRPYPSFEYARSLDEETPSPLPQVA